MKACKLIDKVTSVHACSTAETAILESTILAKQIETKELEDLAKKADLAQLTPVNDRKIRNLQSTLHKKFHKFLSQDSQYWNDWPDKPNKKSSSNKPLKNAGDHISVKKFRNTIKRQRRINNMLKKVAEESLSSGSVINLSDQELPPEVYSVLNKQTGFVATSGRNSLETRTDCMDTMAKLSTATYFKIKELKEKISTEENEKNYREM